MEQTDYWVRAGGAGEIVGDTPDSAHSTRQAAEARAKHLAGQNPDWRFVVVDKAGSIVWSPEWQAT